MEADRFTPTIAPQRFPECDDGLKTRLILALHEAIAIFGRSGIDGVADGSLPADPVLRDRCFTILRGVPDTKVVAVRCSVEALRRRETARSDRLAGWAEQQSFTLYDGVHFDLTIDTTHRSPADCARVVLQACFPRED